MPHAKKTERCVESEPPKDAEYDRRPHAMTIIWQDRPAERGQTQEHVVDTTAEGGWGEQARAPS
jgi:hypothetical protein